MSSALLLAFVVGLPFITGKLYTADVSVQKKLWEDYKRDFTRTYETHEEHARFSVFVENLRLIDQLQSEELRAGGSATYGITRFMDMSQKEFKTRYLNTKMFGSAEEMAQVPLSTATKAAGACSPANSTVNWAGQLTTPVKNQGYCGSCWSFAATEQLESDMRRVYGKNISYILSQQQLLDCNTAYPQSGCNGGVVLYALQYLQSHLSENITSYPYTSYYDTSAKSCQYNANNGVGGVKTVYAIVQDESCMASYVLNNGPIYVGVNADAWSAYTGGVMSAAACGNGIINHAVQIVGVSIPGNYWIIRNTWGASWGESGYIRLEYGKNSCNMTYENSLFVDPFVGTSANSAFGLSSSLSGLMGMTVAVFVAISTIFALV